MSKLLIVGSVAFDAIETPFGKTRFGKTSVEQLVWGKPFLAL